MADQIETLTTLSEDGTIIHAALEGSGAIFVLASWEETGARDGGTYLCALDGPAGDQRWSDLLEEEQWDTATDIEVDRLPEALEALAEFAQSLEEAWMEEGGR